MRLRYFLHKVLTLALFYDAMWYPIAKYILRYRILLAILLVLSTVVMGVLGSKVQTDYEISRVIPEDHPSMVEMRSFIANFGKQSSVMVLAAKHKPLFDLKFYNQWKTLGDSIQMLDGAGQLLSIGHGFTFTKDTEARKFVVKSFPDRAPTTQLELDSIELLWQRLPFYQGLLYNLNTDATVMVIPLQEKKLTLDQKIALEQDIELLADRFEQRTDITVYRSGLPVIRTFRLQLIKRELVQVLVVAVIVLIIVLFWVFRSWQAVVFPLAVVGIGVVWVMGLLVLFGYKITLLTAILPNLIVIIGIPNCVYLVNKYHSEYRKHGNKVRALANMIQRIGYTTLFANLTTAIGFGVFYFTGSQMLEEFGIVAAVMIAILFFLSIIAIPVIFSFLPEPKDRQIKHLDRKWLQKAIVNLNKVTIAHPKIIFLSSAIILVFSIYGVTLLQNNGYILDDVPKSSNAYRDLKFLEENFTGVMPLEILIDTKEKGGVMKPAVLEKISDAQDSMTANPLFGKSMSLVNGLKFATQAYYNGNPDRYRLPRSSGLAPEITFIMKYLQGMDKNMSETNAGEVTNSYVDSTKSIARISVQIPDIGSNRLQELRSTLDSIFNPLFPPDEYKVTYTGTSIVVLDGNAYLINGLLNSVGLAFVLIALIMAYLFRTPRMLIISLIPNLIPLMLTAGIMGYMNIPLKPSTVLVFSVAFGISVDFTIHFLAKYKQELSRHRWDIPHTVTLTLKESSVSMIYTSLILFFGFITFTVSQFDGTKYMGVLISITLVSSLFANLFLLPALLYTFDRVPKRKRHLIGNGADV
jgi:predicted RND superfamily exporter protein